MSGAVAWTLRLSDGTEHRMYRGTREISQYINDIDFINEEPSHIEKCLEDWLETKAIWERKGILADESGKLELPHSWGCVPAGYGIVVTDFVTKTIITSQNYCPVGGFSVTWIDSGNSYYGEDDMRRFFVLLSAGRISGFRMRIKGCDLDLAKDFGAAVESLGEGFRQVHLAEFPIKKVSYDEFREFYFTLTNGCNLVEADIDMSPFTVETYDVSAKSWRNIRNRVKELGFALSEAEEAEWESEIGSFENQDC